MSSRTVSLLLASVFVLVGAVAGGASATHTGAPRLDPGAASSHEPIVFPRYEHVAVDIRVDGRLDEPFWADVPVLDQMTVTTPDIGEAARYRTETQIVYTERGIYVGAWNEQPSDSMTSRLSSRDSFDAAADAYQIMVDSSGNGLYGYWFMVKLGGSIADGILLPENNFQNNWDGPWLSATSQGDGGWSVEMFLPWGMMNMPASIEDSRRIAFLITRDIPTLNERWSFPALGDTQPKFLSAFRPATLRGVESRREMSLFPYASFSRDRVLGESQGNAGLDLFWRPDSAFFVSAAVNPDFGQVEADDVVVNLTAFETFFPEKRLFFLENQDVFDTSGDVGGPPRTLLHTRRIGASVGSRRGSPDLDGAAVSGFDLAKPVDLLAASKAVAQRGKHRLAGLVAIEDDTTLALADGSGVIEAPGRDFAILRWQRDDTTDGGRRAFGWLGSLAEHPDRRAFTQAFDVHWDTPDGKWNVDAELMHSAVDSDNGFGFSGTAKYAPRRGDRHYLNLFGYDKRIDLNDVGFLSRNDDVGFFYEFWRRRQDFESIRDTNNWVDVLGIANGDGRLIDAFVVAHQGLTFNNNYNVFANLGYRPAYWDDRNSRGAGSFRLDHRFSFDAGWNSPRDKVLAIGGNVGWWTEHFRGDQVFGNLFVNYQPIDRVRANVSLGYNDRDNWVIWQGDDQFAGFASMQWNLRASLETFFTARQQLTVRLQWIAIQARDEARYRVLDGQPLRSAPDDPIGQSSFAISDVVVQVRYRWQIAPMSDLFVVYNRGGAVPGALPSASFGDLFDEALGTRDREGFVVKLRYRFGI